ncbi:alanine--glyoxylate aminotransferase family protein [Staphylococcus simiae]|uniref:pyridoxal-phosphate-dependent aminotransferase family protein n=1 Tax=Staphylococcus simiae TaxID=308354 RepID=UPI001A96EDC4|nr:alanine--glyoxylate aminotransferase family protein [Staphylococcus simiae]MBO1199560.1 alanine--glyoxylate aminotransferase family protein [Staphylococcus simiae]MBO1201836.1 alanine--glyoxylate aminotransferase family protein [Staphylococcus simiae]MBO1204057.1 alanine--glyoxylate aminotransferase family protein [Staphylococcus simiae]MBO1211577.1 alanine--glyoxylate aminotransferase family protein [Staphylococcus simiae]MBO1230292.1 alanine--glyoxylate aminotransferase family protein [St
MYYHHSLLLTPGPTPVPDHIMKEIQSPMVGHRSSDFEDIAEEAFHGLKPIFGSQNDVLILTSSGTSVLEASMLNIINPDDHFVIIVSGAFGNRFKQIAQTYYKNVHIYDVEWGKAVNVEEFITYLKSLNVTISAVFSQFCETSTTVLHPIHDLGNAIHHYNSDIFFVVDGVSCIGAVDVDLAKDKIDVLVSGSQKAIMLPPGLAFVAYNQRAKDRFQQVTTPRFYLDLNKYISSQVAHSTPFTPNVALFRGVNAYVESVKTEGFNHVIERHYAIRNALRQALKALNLDLLVNDHDASPTVTAFIPKDKEEVNHIKNQLKQRFNITIAGGQGHLKGHILRIGHMGQVSPFDILSVVAALEIILSDYRQVSLIGQGTAKFMEVIHNEI